MYDISTGKAKLPTSTLDEIHTGSFWEQARQKYCGDSAFMTKQILMYLVHFHVHHLFVHYRY
jgi:hypothetical protein